MNWTMPLGTQIQGQAGYTPSQQTGDNANNGNVTTWTVSLTQPLIKNFGLDVNEVNLNNAQDQQTLDNYTLLDTVSQTVTTITSDYYALVQAQLALNIARRSLTATQKTLKDREVEYRFGRIAKDDVEQARLDVSTQQQSFTQAKQTFVNAKAQLLNDLGLPGNTEFQVDEHLDISKITPDLSKSQAEALKNNRTYLEAKLNFQIAERNLLTLENNRRWELDLELSATKTRNNTNYAPATDQPSSNNIVTDNSASLNLTIPLDAVSLDQSHLEQAVNDENAVISLEATKRTLMTEVANTISNLSNSWQSLQIAKEQLKLQQETYRAAELKVQFGKLDTFSLSQQLQNLIQSENALVSAEINYLELKTQYKQMMGTLLKDWNINVKLPYEDNDV